MILEYSVRYLRKIATPSFFIFWLLIGILSSVFYGLSMMIRGLSFEPLFWLAFIGFSLSWWLARTRLNNWLAFILFLLVGVGVIYLWVGNLVTPILNLARALFQSSWLAITAYIQEDQNFVADFTSVQLALSEVMLNANTTWTEFVDWLESLFSRNPAFHVTAVFLAWGLLAWIVSAWAGWVYQRYKNVIVSVFPGYILLVVPQSYTYAEPTALIVLLFLTLLLLAFTWLNNNENRWIKSKVDYPDDVRMDSVIAFASISIILVFVAFFLPRISIRKMVEMVREFTNPQIEQAAPFIESFGIEPSKPNIGRFGTMLNAGLPRSHLIGAGPELSQQIVMSVQITAGLPPGIEADDTIPLYWRGLTYDQYTGDGWDSSDVTLRHYRSDQQVGLFERPGYWIVEQEVRFPEKSELLFAAGDLISVDKNYRVAWRSEPWFSEIEKYPGDLFGAVTDEIDYQAQTFVPVVDENTLRSSGWKFPDWIRENYVLVPIETPQRVINVTRQLIDGVDNPYDRARIIEQYLRRFVYTTDLPLPPTDRDIVDYFLFDLKKGYCDYFASAMVVMARAADLPARLVVGYSRGTYDSANDRYVITEANAHSWPEIYFAGIGWVPFEPTSGLKEIARSETPLQFPGDASYVIEAESLMKGIKPLFGSWLITLGIVILVVIWAQMVWVTLDEWWLKRLSPSNMVSRLYGRLYKHGRRVGVPAQKQDTPHDFSAALRRQFSSFFGLSTGRKSVQQIRRDILDLTNIYTRAQFSPQGITDEDKDDILSIWQRLRRQLLLARGLYWVKTIRTRSHRVTNKNNGEHDE